jgi:hypothetical protein
MMELANNFGARRAALMSPPQFATPRDNSRYQHLIHASANDDGFVILRFGKLFEPTAPSW